MIVSNKKKDHFGSRIHDESKFRVYVQCIPYKIDDDEERNVLVEWRSQIKNTFRADDNKLALKSDGNHWYSIQNLQI